MSLCSSFFLLLHSLRPSLDLLLHLVFSLFDQTCFQPLFEFHVGDLLFLLFLKLLDLVFLHLLEFLVMDAHDLLVLPFVHLMRALLHADGFLLLLLD